MARPTKLNKMVSATICGHVRAGNYLETAAKAAGIGERTVHEWLRRGRDETTGIYADFAFDVDQAAALSEIESLKLVSQRPDDWQAIAWKLERRFPDRWGRKQRVEHSGDPTEPVTVRLAFDPD